MTNFPNPIIWADVPDPSVIRVGDVYYMTSTTMYFTPGCPVMKSMDLINWEIIGYVYDTLANSDEMTLSNGKHDYGKGSWASCLRYHNGMFYVSFVAYNTGKTYIYQTTNIEKGDWQKYIIDGIYHDMSLLFDDDGRVYMVYGCGAIRVVELNANATALLDGGMNKIIIPHADPTGGTALAEGAHIYKMNGYYYIFIIAWPRSGSGRRIQVCYRAGHIDGVYDKRVILDDNMGFQNAGVAQGGIVDTPEGLWLALLFQDHGAVGRIPVLVPMAWEDAWPVLGVEGRVPTTLPCAFLPQTAGCSPNAMDDRPHMTSGLAASDDFNDAAGLGKQWQWNHNPVHGAWSLTARTGWLRLVTSHIATDLMDARNTLTQRTEGPTCAGVVCMDITGMQDGDVAGLAALQEKYGLVGVTQKNDVRYISLMCGDKGVLAQEEYIPLPSTQNKVYLRIRFDFEDALDEATFQYSLCGEKWVKLGKTLKMEYRLSHFTGYRYALFNYATQSIGGYVDFDGFKHICPAG
ncbi:MAG: glycoside hydrolase 43 family protein [Defluviitaleaceae bacterium]|nr:glycoside hydrolase 43 family protein [Defluviitaleaceae bacterium]